MSLLVSQLSQEKIWSVVVLFTLKVAVYAWTAEGADKEGVRSARSLLAPLNCH